MLKHEAEWAGDALRRYAPSGGVALNLGSQSAAFRGRQEYLTRLVLRPLAVSGFDLVHVDLVQAPGVDEVGDLTDEAFVERLSNFRPSLVLCSNLLEHVAERERLIENVKALLPRGAVLLVTGPHRVPYHPDPIDTMYRPTLEELTKDFSGLDLLDGAVVPCGTYVGHVLRRLWSTQPSLDEAKHVARSVRSKINVLGERRRAAPVASASGRGLSAVCAVFRAPASQAR